MTACPRCRDPVIETPTGELLTPEPTAVGIWKPNGTRWTAHEMREALKARHRIGHSLHDCKPLVTSRKASADDDQASLF